MYYLRFIPWIGKMPKGTIFKSPALFQPSGIEGAVILNIHDVDILLDSSKVCLGIERVGN